MQFLSTRQEIFITDRKSVIYLINRTNCQQLHICIINPVRKQLCFSSEIVAKMVVFFLERRCKYQFVLSEQ